VLLNIDDPANPGVVGDSDFRFPDPLMPEFEFPEGNSHQSYWDADNEFVISTDEDFSPFRTSFEMTTGPNAGRTVPVSSASRLRSPRSRADRSEEGRRSSAVEAA
jgi:hypothetical protein